MKVLIVTSNFPASSSDATTPMVLNLARELVRQGLEVTVLTPHRPGAASREDISGVVVRRFRYLVPARTQSLFGGGATLINLRNRPMLWLQVPLYLVALFLAVRRLIKRGNFDVVHSQWVMPQGVVVEAAMPRRRVPHVITVRGGDVFSLRHPILERIKSWGLRRAEAVTVNSSATMAEVERLTGSDILPALVRGGVAMGPPDPSLATAIKKTHGLGRFEPVIAFLGRVVEEKGVFDLLEAFPLIVAENPTAGLLFIGEGQDSARLRSRAESLGLSERVILTGWVPHEDLPSYLASADAMVGPSRRADDGWTEAQGMVFVEAMVCGVPVVATEVGGIPDIVVHGVTGLLVPERRPDEIARSVNLLLASPRLAEELVETARHFAISDFGNSAMGTNYRNVYQMASERLLESRKRRTHAW